MLNIINNLKKEKSYLPIYKLKLIFLKVITKTEERVGKQVVVCSTSYHPLMI
jgi:hypothetical protein